MTIHEVKGNRIIDFLRVFISWPLATVALVIFVCIKFPTQVGSLIDRIKKLPGVEIDPKQPLSVEKKETQEERAQDTIILTKKDQDKIDEIIEGLDKRLQLETDSKTKLAEGVEGLKEKLRQVENDKQKVLTWASEQLTNKERELIFWFFKYCENFFVPITKKILNGFSKLPPQTKEQYHSYWFYLVPSAAHREGILNVLQSNSMLTKDKQITITDIGKQFLSFINYKDPQIY
ncbi:hypothetical protein KJ671_00865 [Patescibacteria group bacterium]|nr:hypothetical protein [Patescibacteria group bacterium]